MARRRVDQTIEHRITLGNYERKEFKETMDSIQLNQNVVGGAKIVASLVGVAAIGGLGYLAVKAYAIGKGAWLDLTGGIDDILVKIGLKEETVAYDEYYNLQNRSERKIEELVAKYNAMGYPDKDGQMPPEYWAEAQQIIDELTGGYFF